jgi:hypothetical protein
LLAGERDGPPPLAESLFASLSEKEADDLLGRLTGRLWLLLLIRASELATREQAQHERDGESPHNQELHVPCLHAGIRKYRWNGAPVWAGTSISQAI